MSKIERRVEFRKIQLTGGSTYIISLPKNWIDYFNLKRGTMVEISQGEDMSLSILPREMVVAEKDKKIILNIKENDTSDSVRRGLISSYLNGYNIIVLKTTQKRLDPEIKASLKSFIRKNLVGTEIMNDRPNELTLQVLVSYSDLKIKDTLRRMALIASSMHREAISSLSGEHLKAAKEIIEIDDEVDRFNLYLIRLLKVAVINVSVLRESGLLSTRSCIDYSLIVKSIERLADHAVKIAKNSLNLTLIPIEKNTLKEINLLSELALNIFEKSMEALYNESYSEADKLIADTARIRHLEGEVIHSIIKKAPIEDVSILRLIVESIMRTVEYGSDIAETVLNINISENSLVS